MTHGDELRDLLDALREETLTAEEGRRLETLLREDDEALRTYIRTVAMQADLRGHLVGWVGVGDVDDPEGPEDPAAPFQDPIYGQPACEVMPPQGADEDEPLALPALPPPGAAGPEGWLGLGARTWAALTAVAALLVIGLGVWLHGSGRHPIPVVSAPSTRPVVPYLAAATEPSPPPVVATVTASVGAAWEGPGAPTVLGAPLRAGSDVTLVRGFARLTFSTGAEVILEAPSRVTVESGARVVLERGRLTANVPGPARGFAVATRLVEVVDLGTEFGVSVAGDGTVDLPVFTGQVQARPTTGADARPVSVVAGQAGRVRKAGVELRPAGPEAAQFVRDIRQIRGALPVFGTGQGLRVGDSDPHWLLASVSRDPTWKARPAAVCGPGPQGLANDARSGWVSTAGDRPSVRAGLYTFVTTFDLGQFDAATARLHLRLGVDNYVREVRLNGRATGIKLAVPGAEAKQRLHDFDVNEGFRSGSNELEVVVENSEGAGTKGRPNAMALRAELSGTAVRRLDDR
jgi:hypothetical protein